MRRRSTAVEWLLVAVCIAAGGWFSLSLERLWPLADVDLVVPSDEIATRARDLLTSRGFDLTGYGSATALTVDSQALDYLERGFGLPRVQEWIRSGLPIVRYRADFKKRGERTSYTVRLHPAAGPLGWEARVEEDRPGQSLDVEQARNLARDAIEGGLKLDPSLFEERAAASTEQVKRRDHRFRFERLLSEDPELRERIDVVIGGDEVLSARRSLAVPAAARRSELAAAAPRQALETLGVVLVVGGAGAALFIFLRGLGDRSTELRRATIWPAAVFVCLMATYALESPSLFRYWEPLWPKWISDFQYLSYRAIFGLLVALMLMVMVAAGDVLDRRSAAGRGGSLWTLAGGRVIDAAVAHASWRGFLIGLLCGGVLAAVVALLQLAVGAEVSIQPRGFFFYTLNTAAPAATSLLFFFGIALTEELGYRFFGGTWLLGLTRRVWAAVLVPGLVYGLTHARMDFLPPAEPWWARALALTAVGCVWGWAFFRYDALTVVLSHYTADLFIFNWPRLASGQTGPVVVSVLTICVPLIPALLWVVFGRKRRDTSRGDPAGT